MRRIADGQRGQSGDWKYRDHGLFVCFAPADKPRYAASVVIEHGLGGARAAAPVAKDVLTFLFDRNKAMEAPRRRSSSSGAARSPSALHAAPPRSRPRSRSPQSIGMISSAIIPQPLAKLPWRLIFLVAGIAMIGLMTQYSAAGGSIRPWALRQGMTFLFFLCVAVVHVVGQGIDHQEPRLPDLWRGRW